MSSPINVMNISIRRATLEDVEDMANIFVSCVRTLNAKDYTSEQIEIMVTFCDAQSYLEEIEIGGSVFVAEAKSIKNIVGFASLAKNRGHIDDLFVAPNYTCRGIGTLLLETIEKVAIAKQKSQLSVMASLTARSFYLSRGFKYVKDSQIFDVATGIEIPGVDMVKILPANSICNTHNMTFKSFDRS